MKNDHDSPLGGRPRRWLAAVSAAAVLALGGIRAEALGPGGASPKSDAADAALLVESFESVLKDQNIDAFRSKVEAIYTEAALTRILTTSPDVRARRAAALASGLLANFQASNAAVAKGLKDGDPSVRNLTENALWAIWFRAGTPEDNKAVAEVSRLIGSREFDRAIETATRLIDKAPDFAEAYNQRAIAHYLQGNHAKSIEDCRRVLALNPYHFGALTGMAGCYRVLGQPRKMLSALRQALRVRPYDEAVAETIKSLEAELGADGSSEGIEI